MSIAEPLSVLKSELLQKIVPELVDLLASAQQDGRPVHKVEEDLWDVLLRTGNRSMKAFFDSHGTGDLGPTLTLPTGEQVNRLESLHTRQYVSIFGRFELKRVVYGSREGQALDFVPLDNRLQFPESDFSVSSALGTGQNGALARSTARDSDRAFWPRKFWKNRKNATSTLESTARKMVLIFSNYASSVS